MTTTSVSPPWSLSKDTNEDSAFHEPEYSNSNGFSSPHSSPCPDYEEVVESTRLALAKSGLVYNLASEGIFKFRNNGGQKAVSGGVGLAAPTVAADPVVRNKIMKSLIYCIHKDEGCSWTGPLSGLKGHLHACQKDAVACLNQCGAKIARLSMEDHMLYTCTKRLVECAFCRREFTGAAVEDHQTECGFEPVHCENKCGLRIQRNRLKAHQINTCSKRMVSCQFCARSFSADTVQGHHAKCLMFPVRCPNGCAADAMPREEVEQHVLSACPNGKALTRTEAVEECSFREAGCAFEVGSGVPLERHMSEATALHLDLMCKLATRQQEHISRLSQQLERAHTSYTGVLLWKIKDLRAKMAEARSSEGLELVSMLFYTSQCGYRLQASLFLHGNGGGEGSHLSVYIKLLPGEFDSILRWPFRHTVSFTLLDQSSDRQAACNVVESFIPDPTWPNFCRPSREPDQLGFGFPKFVPHAMLNTREYIREDAIFIKIRVDPSRNVAV